MIKFGEPHEKFARMITVLFNLWFFSGVGAAALYQFFKQGSEDGLLSGSVYLIVPAMSVQALSIALIPCFLALACAFCYLMPFFKKQKAQALTQYLVVGAFLDIFSHAIYSRFLVDETANVFHYRLDTAIGSLLFVTSPFLI